MRLILALSLPEIDLSDQRFKKLKTNMITKNIDFNFLPMEQLHVPIAELGDVGKGVFLAFHQKIKSIIQDHSIMKLKMAGLWASPYQQEADMLWMGVQNSKALRALQAHVGNELNLDEDNFFRPQAPLVYLKRKTDVKDIISPFKNFDFGTVRIDQVRILEKLSGTFGLQMRSSYYLNEPGESESHSHPGL